MNRKSVVRDNPPAPVRCKALWLATATVLLGAFLRLGAFQEALVGADQSSILAAAADIAALRDFPGVGIKSSVGVMQTAIPAYLAALPLLVVRRVIAIKWFFSVLDILAIAALYRAVRQTVGRRAALVAALLYATNPWVVEFNRWIWYQSLVPTFATLAFATLLSALHDTTGRRQVSIPATTVYATLMGLVHLAALPWAATVSVLALATALRRRWWRAMVLAMIGAFIVASPYLAFLARGGIADVRLLLNGADTPGTGLNTAAYRLSMELLSGEQVLATPRSPLWRTSVLNTPSMYAVIPALLAVSVAWALVTMLSAKRRTTWGVMLPLVWTLLAPTLFLPTDIHLQHFYLLYIFPSPFVLIGIAADALITSDHLAIVGRGAAIVGKGMLVAAALVAVWWSHLWVVRIGYEQRGQLRAPTRAWLMDRAVDVIAGYLDATPTGQVIVVTHFGGESSPFDWIRNFVGSDRVRVVPAGQSLIVPRSETCYMVAERASTDQLSPLAPDLAPAPGMTVPATPPWTFHCTGPRPELAEPRAVWSNGLSLLSAEVAGDWAPGGQLHIATRWHYAVVTDGEYHFFNHLMLGDQLVAQVDGEGVPKRYWRDGDVFLTYFTLQLPGELPAGDYALRVGAYTWPDIVRIPRIDGQDAATIAEWVR